MVFRGTEKGEGCRECTSTHAGDDLEDRSRSAFAPAGQETSGKRPLVPATRDRETTCLGEACACNPGCCGGANLRVLAVEKAFERGRERITPESDVVVARQVRILDERCGKGILAGGTPCHGICLYESRCDLRLLRRKPRSWRRG